MSSRNLQHLLEQVSCMAGLSPESLAHIASKSRLVTAERGEALVLAGDECNGIYAVLKGHVSLLARLGNGSRKVLLIAGAGETFGESSLFLGRPWTVDAVAAQASSLIYIDKQPILEELDSNPRFARQMIGTLSRQVEHRTLDARTSAMSGLQRVAALLLEAAGRKALRPPAVLTLPATKHEVASRLDLTPEHLSRMLRTLSERGAIRVSGLCVTILAPQVLRDIVSPQRSIAAIDTA
jgi:CRP-like cAMP-binding protein